jgi:hypothetical protein
MQYGLGANELGTCLYDFLNTFKRSLLVHEFTLLIFQFSLRIEFHEKSTKDRKCSRTTVTHYSAARVSDIKYKINTCFGSIDFVEIFGSGIKKARGSCKS